MAFLGLAGVLAVGAAAVLPAVFLDERMPSGIFLVVIVVLLALVTGLSLLGRAVIRHEPWARAVGIGYGVISLVVFPIGTLAGVYVIWQLIFGWNESDTAD